MKTFTEYRAEVGQAVWLFWNLYVFAAQSPEKWWSVHGGAYSDEGVAASLDVSTATARRWRVKLEQAGLIRTFPVTRRRRRFEILNLGFTEGMLDTRSSAQPSELSPRLVN
jgi:hypothetical protein